MYRNCVAVIIVVCLYTADINDFKLYRLRSYFTENTFRLQYKDQSVRAVGGNNRCYFENHVEHVTALCGQDVMVHGAYGHNVMVHGAYDYHGAMDRPAVYPVFNSGYRYGAPSPVSGV